MKSLLIPLLIIGMFVSFAAALIAMLFFTKTVETPQELVQLVTGGPDSTEVFDQFMLQEDKLQDLFELAQEYKSLQEEQAQAAETIRDSLVTERSQLQSLEDSLMTVQQQLGLLSDSTKAARQSENLRALARYYSSVKAQVAADILQQESELSDTTVALLMKELPPRQMGKIMGSMAPDYAARITKLMKDLSQ